VRTYRCDVTELVLFTSKDLPQNPPHDLAASRLRQIGNHIDGFWRREWPDALAHLHGELLAQRLAGLIAIFDSDKRVDCLASELVCHANDGSLGNRVVLDKGGFDLGCGEAVTGNVHNVVNAAADPVEAFVVTACAIASKLRFMLAAEMIFQGSDLT
jgi:hypothetical protein